MAMAETFNGISPVPILKVLLPLLSNVEEVSFEGEAMEDVKGITDIILEHRPTLLKLEFASLEPKRGGAPGLARLLAGLPHLTKLYVPDFALGKGDNTYRPTFRLKDLQIGSHFILSDLDFLAASSSKSLHYLRIAVVSGIAYRLNKFPALKSLTLLGFPKPPGTLETVFEALVAAVASCQNLEDLELSDMGDRFVVPRQLVASKQLFEKLPQTLVSLLIAPRMDTSDLTNFLKKKDWCPKLKSLRLAHRPEAEVEALWKSCILELSCLLSRMVGN